MDGDLIISLEKVIFGTHPRNVLNKYGVEIIESFIQIRGEIHVGIFEKYLPSPLQMPGYFHTGIDLSGKELLRDRRLKLLTLVGVRPLVTFCSNST